MKVFITGATGFIGRHLIEALIASSAHIELLALTRNIKKAKQLNVLPIQWFDKISAEMIDSADVIINLAGEPIADKRWSSSQKSKICNSRWNITQDLAEHINASDHPPHTFISASAIGFYGRQNSTAINEGFTDYFPEFSHQICKKWESLALSVNARKDKKQTRVAILRTGIVLDKKQGALAKMLLPFKLGLGGKIASGEQYMSWIHISDMVNAIIHVINTKTLEGAINITAPSAVSNNEFSHTLSKSLSRPCIFITPEFVLRCIFGEMADLLVYGQNVYPHKLLESGFNFNYPKLPLALDDILK